MTTSIVQNRRATLVLAGIFLVLLILRFNVLTTKQEHTKIEKKECGIVTNTTTTKTVNTAKETATNTTTTKTVNTAKETATNNTVGSTSSETTLVKETGYFHFDDPQCAGNKHLHPRTLSSEQQMLEYGFHIYNRRKMTNETFRVRLRYLVKRSAVAKRFYAQHLTDEQKCIHQRVPRKLHWVWVGGILPEKYINNIYGFALRNPGWEVFLWSDHEAPTDLKGLLGSIFAKFHFRNVTQYIEQKKFVNGDLILREKNLAGKSDYTRLEAVYLEGGIYEDTDSSAVRPFDSVGDLFRWPWVTWDSGTYKNVANAMFGFEQTSAFLRFAILLARENCLRFRRCGVLSGVGPNFLTTAVAIYDSPEISFIHCNHLVHRLPRDKQHPSNTITFHTGDATWLPA